MTEACDVCSNPDAQLVGAWPLMLAVCGRCQVAQGFRPEDEDGSRVVRGDLGCLDCGYGVRDGYECPACEMTR